MTSPGGDGTARPARDLAAALGQADRDRAVACKTRNVVLASAGVLQQQKARRNRNRGVALAAIVLVLMSLGPLIWIVVDSFNSGARLGDIVTQCSLWACILCPALLAAALVGWLRRSSR
jgi:hypothetical protein